MITLATLPNATAQEVFDQVVNHLRQQKVKSQRLRSDEVTFMCVYRNPEGKRCAAGCLIGDNEYNLSMEGAAWTGLVSLGKVPADHSDLIEKLQGVHDFGAPASWEGALAIVAEDFNLKYTPPNAK